MRISTAAKMLDRERPGWYKKVSLRKLDMDDCLACVLGQIDGHWRRSDLASKTGVLLEEVPSHEIEKLVEPAFDCRVSVELWKEQIRARRNGHGPNKRRKART